MKFLSITLGTLCLLALFTTASHADSVVYKYSLKTKYICFVDPLFSSSIFEKGSLKYNGYLIYTPDHPTQPEQVAIYFYVKGSDAYTLATYTMDCPPRAWEDGRKNTFIFNLDSFAADVDVNPISDDDFFKRSVHKLSGKGTGFTLKNGDAFSGLAKSLKGTLCYTYEACGKTYAYPCQLGFSVIDGDGFYCEYGKASLKLDTKLSLLTSDQTQSSARVTVQTELNNQGIVNNGGNIHLPLYKKL